MHRSESHPAYWTCVARTCAQKAHSQFRSTPRGVMHVEEADVLVFFDSAPPRGSMLARERAVSRFRAHLADAGIRVLATATYPQSGPDDGLSLAVVLDAGAGEGRAVTTAWEWACHDALPPEGGRPGG